MPKMRSPNLSGKKEAISVDANVSKCFSNLALILIHPRRVNVGISQVNSRFDDALARSAS